MKKILVSICIGVCLAALFVGCQKSEGKTTVSTDGSTSMEKLIGVLGESYEIETGVTVSYNPTGSSAGINAVLEERCDIGLSSRSLKAEERALGLVETVVAYDGIAIIVHPENPVASLTLEQIQRIYTGEVKDWKEVADFSGEIVLIGREAGSGTRDGFESITGTVGKCDYRQELTSTGDVITTVSQNPNAIGYTSVASVKDSVKVVAVNEVLPAEATIRDGSYPVQRPFVMITRADTALPPLAQEFFDYAISPNAGSVIALAGVVAAN